MPETSAVQRASERFKASLLANERAAASDMVQQYGGIWRRLKPQVDALIKEVEDSRARGEQVQPAAVARSERLRQLLAQVEDEVGKYAEYADASIRRQQSAAIEAAAQHAEDLTRAAMGDAPSDEARLALRWNRLPREAVADLVGQLASGAPLDALLGELGPDAAQRVKDALLEGLAMGRNPRVIARDVRRGMGMPLTRSLRLSRTETLRAYRRATLANYQANSDVVKGWRWSASHSSRTCFPAGTLIETKRGKVAIEDVGVGDMVLTHTGRYRRVYETFCHRADHLVTLETRHGRVTATADHLFLVKRNGQLDWVRADRLVVGDVLLRYADGVTNEGDHIGGDVAVQVGIGQPDDAMTSSGKPFGLTPVLPSSLFGAVPVSPVYLDNGIGEGQVKVNRVAPAGEYVFSLKHNAQTLETQPDVVFGFGLPNVAAIAAGGAELLIGHCGDDAKLFAAGQARIDHRRAAARLRTILTVGLCHAKRLAASRALSIGGVGRSALSRAEGVHNAGCGSERLTARRAGAFHGTGSVGARSRTEAAILMRHDDVKRFAALRARLLETWHAARRGDALADETALIGAEAATPVDVAGGQFKGLAAHLARYLFALSRALPHRLFAALGATEGLSKALHGRGVTGNILAAPATRDSNLRVLGSLGSVFHDSIITQKAYQSKPQTIVYNLEVDVDHSYVAGGFVAHNCLACLAMDGKVFPLDKPAPMHVQCRCSCIPVTVSWRDLGVDASDVEPGPTGAEWFAAQPASVQREMMGDEAYKAWKAGRVTLDDFVGVSKSRTWGDSVGEVRLKDALAQAGKARDFGEMKAKPAASAINPDENGTTIGPIKARWDGTGRYVGQQRGDEIYLGPQWYDDDQRSPASGVHVIAHELAHTMTERYVGENSDDYWRFVETRMQDQQWTRLSYNPYAADEVMTEILAHRAVRPKWLRDENAYAYDWATTRYVEQGISPRRVREQAEEVAQALRESRDSLPRNGRMTLVEFGRPSRPAKP